MSTNQPTPVILSDADLAEIEAGKYVGHAEIRALCQTVRAAWVERDGLRGRATELHNRIGERNERIVVLLSENTALRERLAETERERNSLRGLRGQVVGLNTRLAQVEQERNDLRSSLDAERRAVNVLAGEIKP